MKTSKPFSTISYMHSDFLEKELNLLILNKTISFWCYVYHYAEADENGKNHIHLFIVPNGKMDTSIIEDMEELNEDNSLLPFKCLPVRSSKFDDWYLYAKHDKGYLATKMQTRNYEYFNEDFHSSNYELFLEYIHLVNYSKYYKTQEFVNCIHNGINFREMVENGFIPVQQLPQYIKLYEILMPSEEDKPVYRNEEGKHD